ncbi:MAG: hypoxanthine phosphoribosyltransferase, partial [Clostridia bacterium]|nr:hypoxanthine phosphoribosyltransferase [Clostridia bacterium]
MINDIEKVFYTKEQLHEIAVSLGKQISEDYKDKNLLLVSILKGSVVFMADLMREITVPCKIDFMCVSSYNDSTVSSGVVKIVKDLDINLSGYDVLIVEDILD